MRTLGIGNIEQTKSFMVWWWRGCWGGRAAVRKGLGLSECGGWASNGVQIELRAPLRFCMVKSELHFNFDWAPFGIGKRDSTWFFFFAMKTSLHDLILFFCNGDFIARPDSFFVMVLPFGSHWKKNQALNNYVTDAEVSRRRRRSIGLAILPDIILSYYDTLYYIHTSQY